jgi:ATP-dependent Clp protease ATP-binding subunit ClpB
MTSNIGSEYLVGDAEIERIVDLMLDGLRDRLGERQMKLEITPDARRFIARQGYDPVYGARPRRRFISREVETRPGRDAAGRSTGRYR